MHPDVPNGNWFDSAVVIHLMRRFELTACLFVAFNIVCAVLVLREARSLLWACDDAPGPPGDCLEPYNFLGIEGLIAIWIIGSVVSGGLAVAFYVRDIRRPRSRTYENSKSG